MSLSEEASAREILGKSGPVAAALSAYEERSEQERMAEAVEGALFSGRNLIVEAGTGVGKSFAYLVPAILAARTARMRVVISTHTISLQEQLVGKDIPFLEKNLGIPFTAVLAKGRSNYLCIRRLYRASVHQGALFDRADSLRELSRIIDWAYETSDGSLSDIEPQPSREVWEKVSSDRSVCGGSRCKHYRKCFFQRARKRLREADVVIANHSLFFSDLALHSKRGGFLPPYEAVIFDEAHSLEPVASEHFGLDVSNYAVRYLLANLYNPKTGKGFLTVIPDNDLRRRVSDLYRYAEEFFDDVGDWLDTRAPSNGRVEQSMGLVNTLSAPLKELAKKLREARGSAESSEDELELAAYADRCLELAFAVEGFLMQRGDDFAFWVERGGRRRTILSLKAAPVSIADYMREQLFGDIESVVFTSATLSVGADNDFAYLRKRLGIDEADSLHLGSPFDYYRQVKIVIPENIPSPTEEGYIAAAAKIIEQSVKATEGRAFVLFTSYKMLSDVYERTAPGLKSAGITCYRQGGDLARSSMLERFRNGGPACIFGTDSFWQGVDVPGEALSNVIITRLPFPVPDRPLVAARLEKIRDEGGDGFLEYSLPEAVLRFKQGFGRLVRTKNDTGVVVVLDKRIKQRWYGRAFLDSIPECEIARTVEA
jgi:ATP-dependent DNA helicase DinG